MFYSQIDYFIQKATDFVDWAVLLKCIIFNPRLDM